MRKLLFIVMAMFLLLSLPVHANEISVFFDDERVLLEHYPTVENGQMLIPILNISKAMGYPAEMKESGEWLVRIGKTHILFRLGSDQITVNGTRVKMDRMPKMINGVPYLPLGVLQKATGYELYYDLAQNALFVKAPRTQIVPGAIKVYASQSGHMFYIGANKKIGLADERGNIVVGPEWDEVLPAIRENIVVFRIGNRWGMMHVDHGPIYGAEWERISHYVDRIAIAYRNGTSYALDINGDVIIGGQSDDIVVVGKSLMFTKVLDDTKKGVEVLFYDGKGNPIQTIKDPLGGILKERTYNDAQPWSNHIARVINRVNNEVGLVNYTGVEILSCEYEEVGDLGPDGFARIKKKNEDGVLREGIVGANGIRVAKAEYRKVHLPYADGLCLVEKYGRYGYLDTKGNVAIDFQFEEAHPFVDGKALVRGFVNAKGKKQYYYIDRNGKFVGTPRLGSDGLPLPQKTSKNMVIGKNVIFEMSEKFGLKRDTGEVTWSPVWDEMISLTVDHFAVRKDDKWGLIDRYGRLLTPVKYVKIVREPGDKDIFKAFLQEAHQDKKTKKETPEKAIWMDFNGRVLYETR